MTRIASQIKINTHKRRFLEKIKEFALACHKLAIFLTRQNDNRFYPTPRDNLRTLCEGMINNLTQFVLGFLDLPYRLFHISSLENARHPRLLSQRWRGGVVGCGERTVLAER